jgi:quercetin dioxygenase-like cupin family protein
MTATDAVFSPVKRISYAENSIVSQPVIKKSSGNITLFAFGEGQQLSEHTSPFDAVLHVLEGQAKVCIAENPYQLEAGEIIILPAHIPHSVSALTAFKMLLTLIKDKEPVQEKPLQDISDNS